MCAQVSIQAVYAMAYLRCLQPFLFWELNTYYRQYFFDHHILTKCQILVFGPVLGVRKFNVESDGQVPVVLELIVWSSLN